jgi:hypothetical protein
MVVINLGKESSWKEFFFFKKEDVLAPPSA